MLVMVLFVVPAGLGLVVWRSYRSDRVRAGRGEVFQPEGKLRWSGEDRTP